MKFAESTRSPGSAVRVAARASRWTAALLSVLLAGAAITQTAAPLPTVAPADPVSYLNDIKALTDPKMEGRGDDTKGIQLAMQLLADRYKSVGLDPAGSQGYLQPFSVVIGAKMVGVNS